MLEPVVKGVHPNLAILSSSAKVAILALITVILRVKFTIFICLLLSIVLDTVFNLLVLGNFNSIGGALEGKSREVLSLDIFLGLFLDFGIPCQRC